MPSSRIMLSASAAVLLAIAACSAGDVGEPAVSADTLTRRQRDSIVSTLPIPGAGAVGRALDATDAAAERAGRLDPSDPRR